MMLTLANLSTTDKTRYQLAYANLVNLANGSEKVKVKTASVANRKQLLAFAQDVIKAYTARQDGLDVPLPVIPLSWASDAIFKAKHGMHRGTWAESYNRLFNWFYGFDYKGLEVFASDGNNKLPFHAFSALPMITCPGLGDCLAFCYSFKAFRYPGAFMRQLVNTCRLMSVNGRQEITKAFRAIPKNETVRLYVDGDIHNLTTLSYWFDLAKARQDLRIYGYSKSWEIFLDYAKTGQDFPTNYVLNLSGGSKYESPIFANIRQSIQQLPIVRGEFIAVKTDIHMPKGNTSKEIRSSSNWLKYQQAVMDASKKLGHSKVFVCPGKCGDCSAKTHACGNPALTIPIAIAVH
jgi:hypothetical protein